MVDSVFYEQQLLRRDVRHYGLGEMGTALGGVHRLAYRGRPASGTVHSVFASARTEAVGAAAAA